MATTRSSDAGSSENCEIGSSTRYAWDYRAQLRLLIKWCSAGLSKEEYDALTDEEREQLLPPSFPPVSHG